MITPYGPHVEAPRPDGMHWLPLALRRRMDPAGDLLGALQLARYFARGRYDIVHTHNIKAGQIGRVVAAAMRVPIVVHTIHGMAYSRDTPPVRRVMHATLEKIASLGCDLVFSQSREDLETYVATNVMSREKLVLIGNGIDLSKFDPAGPAATSTRRGDTRRALGVSANEILFISAGRLIVEKGFVELFEAAELARRVVPLVRVAIAGETDERNDTLDAATLDRARQQGVLLLGRRSDMPELYAASDVVVLPSWHEGMPRVLMEGAAMGKPLLATDVCGCREIIVPPRNGLLVPVRNPRALADAMITLARDPELRARLGRENALEARAQYAIERSVGLINDAYDDLLARTRRP
jgi:glycosyltransferase involved in cell wall biosynthesis